MMYICNCIVHVSHNFVFAITVNCLYSCFFCFRALSTQQGGYVRAKNRYYYYYYACKLTMLTSLKVFNNDVYLHTIQKLELVISVTVSRYPDKSGCVCPSKGGGELVLQPISYQT